MCVWKGDVCVEGVVCVSVWRGSDDVCVWRGLVMCVEGVMCVCGGGVVMCVEGGVVMCVLVEGGGEDGSGSCFRSVVLHCT